MSGRITGPNRPPMANTNRMLLSATELAAEADGNHALAEWARLGQVFLENWEPDETDDRDDSSAGDNGWPRS